MKISKILSLSCLLVATSTLHATSFVCSLPDLAKDATFIGRVTIVAGTTESFKEAVYKAKVVEAIKGAELGKYLYFGPYVGTRVGWDYFVFLKSDHTTLKDHLEVGSDPRNSPFGISEPYLAVMCAGYGEMYIDNYASELPEAGEAVVVDALSVPLPGTLRTFESERFDGKVLTLPGDFVATVRRVLPVSTPQEQKTRKPSPN
jgi:hypothetical protein